MNINEFFPEIHCGGCGKQQTAYFLLMLKSMGVLLLASGEAGFDLNRKEKRKRKKDEEKRKE